MNRTSHEFSSPSKAIMPEGRHSPAKNPADP